MSREIQESKRTTNKEVGAGEGWSSLTWDNVEQWAGSRSLSRGEAYQRQGCVERLVIAADGRLLASVSGTRRYVTSAWLKTATRRKRELDSSCTCPVGASGCKHAVAVVLEFLNLLSESKDVTPADPDDPRWRKLTEPGDDTDDEFEQDDDAACDESDQFYEDGEDDERTAKRGNGPAARRAVSRTTRASSKRRTRADWNDKIKAHFNEKSREELAELVYSLVERFPELRREFQERIELSEGDAGRLLSLARRELGKVTGEMGWRNGWTGEGHTPDYSRLKHRFERLIEQGYSDDVVGLGRELIALGFEQVAQSDDEGETASQLTDCLNVVFNALGRSTSSAPDKILYAIDACLQDDYDVVGESVGEILDAEWTPADWSTVADRLAERLNRLPGGKNDDFSGKYQRDQISDFLLDALARAGRKGELLPLCEAEAHSTGSYERLVRFLIDGGEYEQAERWAREGIQKTLANLPGIASGLANSLCEMARQGKRWSSVAAHAAMDFFERPCAHHFDELLKVADRAKCRESVHVAALQFLETGIPPVRVSNSKKNTPRVTIDSSWPLPVPEYLLPFLQRERSQGAPRPHFNVLLDMAIAAKQPEEVLRWYDKIIGQNKNSKRKELHWHEASNCDGDRVAKAIAATHPERALEIYRGKLDANLQHTGDSAYQICAECLRQMRSIYKSLDQEDHWAELIADIRFKYRNRPKFMATLDRIERKKIVDSRKASRR